MSKIVSGVLAAGAVLFWIPSASAGPFTDDLKRCLVVETSEADQVAFARWAVGAMSVHPAISPLVDISDETRESGAQETARLLEELLTVRCKDQAVQAVRVEGPASIASAFEVVGQIAFGTLLQDPKVNAEITKLDEYVDPERIQDALGIR